LARHLVDGGGGSSNTSLNFAARKNEGDSTILFCYRSLARSLAEVEKRDL
jgi:hypothetical protein